MTVDTARTDIANFKTRRSMSTRWTKENQSANVLEEIDDENVVINELKGDLDCHKNLGEFHTRSALGLDASK